MARTGMADLIAEFRNMVDDSGTVYFTDDRAEQILDQNRLDFYGLALESQPRSVDGSVWYTVYTGRHDHLEGSASGTTAFRLQDANGTAITSGYSVDYRTALFTFTADQKGSVRYLDGRSYDLNGAAADGWRELMGKTADDYSFAIENRSFSRSDWFKHCQEMSIYYDRNRSASSSSSGWHEFERGDYLP